MEGQIDVDDADIANGNMGKIAEVLQALGYRASLLVSGENTFVISSTGGMQFTVGTTAGSEPVYLFIARFDDVSASLAEVNAWNRGHVVGPFAVIGEDGVLGFNYPIRRSDLTVMGFTGCLGLWLAMLERFGIWMQKMS